MALWDDVKKNLVEWYTLTSDKTAEAARIGSRRWDKFGISRDIERQFSELGSLIYVGIKDGDSDVLNNEPVLELMRRIEDLEEELANKSQEIDGIRAQYARASSAAGNKQAADEENEQDPVTDTVITDPVLEVGTEESAILVEPTGAEDAVEPEDDGEVFSASEDVAEESEDLDKKE